MQRSKQSSGSMTEGVIWKQLLMFFFPILLGTFFQQLYNTVDAMIVGKAVGKEALAAVGGATGNLISLLVGFFVGISSGATVIISQYYGARRDGDVSRAVHTAACISLIFGGGLTVLGLLLSPMLLSWMQTPETVMPHATAYLRIYFLGMIPQMLYNMGSGILRAIGDSRRPLFFLIAACMTNIVLDVITVIGMDLGVQGAAWATILSQTVSAVLVLITLMRSSASYHLSLRRLRIHPNMMTKIIRIGLPAGLQSVMYSISNVLIQTTINGFDTDVLAGWTAYGKLDGLFWMTINAFGVAATTFSAQNFGAGHYDRMRRGVRVSLFQSTVATAILMVILWFFGEHLYRLFTTDENVIAQGMHILRVLVPFYGAYICVEILSGTVRGAGAALVPALITLFGICVLRVAWILVVLPVHHTLDIVLYSYPITWILTSILFIIYYLKGSWLEKGKKRLGHDMEEAA